MDAAVTETPTTTTSSGSSESGGSAPSTSSESSSAPTTDRPSIKDALSVFNEAAKQQGRRTRGQQQPPVAQAETSTAAGTETTAAPAAATQKGPIPFEVHSTALNNARTKTRTEVEQQYAPLRQWADRARQDPAGFTVSLLEEGLTNPAIAPRLYDVINRMVGGQQQPQRGPAPDALPSPDFQDAHGNKFFSADTLLQKLVPYLEQSISQRILGEVQPGLQTVEQLQAERQAERESAQLKSTMQGHITTARTWPHFAQHEAEIKQALLQAPLTSGHPAEEALLLHSVYQQIVGPKLSQLEREAYNKELRDKANASTSNPSAPGSSGAIPKNVRAKDGGLMKDALAWAARQQSAR